MAINGMDPTRHPAPSTLNGLAAPTPRGPQPAFPWNVAGGAAGVLGGLMALGSLALPWIQVDAILLQISLSLFDIINLDQRFGPGNDELAFFAVLVVLAVLVAGLTGIAGGVTCIVADRTLLRVGGIAVIAAGAILFQSCVVVVLYSMLANVAASAGSASPSLGVFAASLGAILMILGGSAGVVHSLIRRRPGAHIRPPAWSPAARPAEPTVGSPTVHH